MFGRHPRLSAAGVANQHMNTAERFVILLDVDNTLLDNDAVQADLSAHLQHEFGAERRDRYWSIFETLREQLGYADYLGTLQRYRDEVPNDPHLLLMSAFMMDYPFASRVYRGAVEAISRLGTLGPTVILSDGDVVFQPRKIQRSGLWRAVHGRVLIYVHKEQMLDTVAQLYPAQRYIMVDDKLRILSAMKQHWGERLISVFPRQGHYALDPAIARRYPAADVTIESIAELASESGPLQQALR
jgi:FMN phosphatase YigB (HAD superfamily)